MAVKTCKTCGLPLFWGWMIHNGEFEEVYRCMTEHQALRPDGRGRERKPKFGKERVFEVLFKGKIHQGMPVRGC
jgi:hypothetical protein